jgi:hypothetical protein
MDDSSDNSSEHIYIYDMKSMSGLSDARPFQAEKTVQFQPSI